MNDASPNAFDVEVDFRREKRNNRPVFQDTLELDDTFDRLANLEVGKKRLDAVSSADFLGSSQVEDGSEGNRDDGSTDFLFASPQPQVPKTKRTYAKNAPKKTSKKAENNKIVKQKTTGNVVTKPRSARVFSDDTLLHHLSRSQEVGEEEELKSASLPSLLCSQDEADEVFLHQRENLIVPLVEVKSAVTQFVSPSPLKKKGCVEFSTSTPVLTSKPPVPLFEHGSMEKPSLGSQAFLIDDKGAENVVTKSVNFTEGERLDSLLAGEAIVVKKDDYSEERNLTDSVLGVVREEISKVDGENIACSEDGENKISNVAEDNEVAEYAVSVAQRSCEFQAPKNSAQSEEDDVFLVPKFLPPHVTRRSNRRTRFLDVINDDKDDFAKIGEGGHSRRKSNKRRNTVFISTGQDVSKVHNVDELASLLEQSVLLQEDLTPEERLLAHCSRPQLLSFDKAFQPDDLLQVKKVGEGSYGEVYLLPSLANSILKVVPIGEEPLLNGDLPMSVTNVLAEVVVTSELAKLEHSTFVKVHSCLLVSGVYPLTLLSAWDNYDEEKSSENFRPDKELFASEQKFVAFLLRNGGQDLETKKLTNAAQGYSIFCQVAYSLAVAEDHLEFEHRDLHWGNILIEDVNSDEKVDFIIDGISQEVDLRGVRATIIDFSLSRMTLKSEGCAIFNDLSKDEELFQGEGDYQFDIYRFMREEVKDKWGDFHPKTNVFWLHYLLTKLTQASVYRTKRGATHSKFLHLMRTMKRNLLDFKSAKTFAVSIVEDKE